MTYSMRTEHAAKPQFAIALALACLTALLITIAFICPGRSTAWADESVNLKAGSVNVSATASANLSKPKLSVAAGPKTLKVKWKKLPKKCKKVEIQVSKNRDFIAGKGITKKYVFSKSGKTFAKRFASMKHGLKANTIYVRTRAAYPKSNGAGTRYTAWTNASSFVIKANAKYMTFYYGKHYQDVYDAYSGGNTFKLSAETLTGRVTGLKNSNPAVAKAKIVNEGYAGRKVLNIVFKKPGTTTVTFKYRGKKITRTVRAYKWENPFKTFKIGSTNIKRGVPYVADYWSLHHYIKRSKGKLVIKPAKNWQLKSIYLGSYKNGKLKWKKISNGHVFTREFEPDGKDEIKITMKNKKTGMVAVMGTFKALRHQY